MKKWIINLMMFLVLVGIVQAIDICEDVIPISSNCSMITPTISCTIYNYTVHNSSGSIIEQNNLTVWNGSIYYFDFVHGQGEYVIKLCEGTTRVVEVGGEDEMASLAITLFILIVTSFFVVLPFIKKEFVQEKGMADVIINMVIRRGCYAIAIFLMTLNTAIVANISIVAGIGAEKELLNVYMIILGWGGYIALIFLVIGTFLQIIKMTVDNKKRLRMGE
jgi:hypothetical protein